MRNSFKFAVSFGFMSFLFALTLFFGFSVQAMAEEVDRSGYTSSKVCGYCHVDIYKGWNKSVHSRAYANPIFMTAYSAAYLETKGDAKDYCLKCHAPAGLYAGDTDMATPVSKEGVTCDFCHTIENVDIENAFEPFTLDKGGEKRASMKLYKTRRFEGSSAAHVATYTDWFNKAELCGGCHEMTNQNGLKIGLTYSEWKASDYAKNGIQCQDCHMSGIARKPVDASVKSHAVNTVPDHSLSHNIDHLRGAVQLEIVTAKLIDGATYMVEVAMTNTKAGHNIPTGIPSRKLELAVTLRVKGSSDVTQVKTFGKVIVDQNGEYVTSDVGAFLDGVKMVRNTAIRPQERRVTQFVFNVPASGKISVLAEASLVYNSKIVTTEKRNIPLGTVRR